jgi:hypothetical protein
VERSGKQLFVAPYKAMGKFLSYERDSNLANS